MNRAAASYHQMIRDLMASHSKKLYPWAIQAATSAMVSPAQAPILTPGGYPSQPINNPVPLIYNDQDSDYNPHYEDMQETPCEITFELDGWQIEKYVNSPPSENDWISHYCPVYGWRYRIDQWQLMSDGVCPECCTEVPEEVMGVWKLKNFDTLPDVEESRRMSGSGGIYASSAHKEDPPWWA